MVMIGVDPHKGSHTAVVVDGDERELDELRLRSSSQAVRCVVGLGRTVPAAAVGDRVRVWSRLSPRPATGCGGRGRSGRPADVVGAGASAGLDESVEERPARCALGSDRGVAAPASPGGGRGRSHCDPADVGQPPPRVDPAADASGVPAPRPARQPHPRRSTCDFHRQTSAGATRDCDPGDGVVAERKQQAAGAARRCRAHRRRSAGHQTAHARTRSTQRARRCSTSTASARSRRRSCSATSST